MLAASLVLVAFIGLTLYALERAFERSALSALEDRLQSYMYSFLARTDLSRTDAILLPEALPEPRLERPGSGLYAAVYSSDFSWTSPSAIDRDLPFEKDLRPGEIRFQGPVRTKVGGVYLLSMGVAFESRSAKGDDVQLTINIGEHQSSFRQQTQVYRDALRVILGGLGLMLILFQVALVRWSLQPLRTVSRDLERVERGEAEQLPGSYPRELEALTGNFNNFIRSEREHLRRYRNTLGDLAHSLKTPLAVMRGLYESDNDTQHMREAGLDQVTRMDEIVAYQLARAAKSGHQTYAAPLEILPVAEEIARTLERVYASKGALAEFEVDERARFHGEKGDLMELLGNLTENAFKWCRSRVLLTVERVGGSKVRRQGLRLIVEDDGPGIPDDKLEDVLKRGVRGDERVQGHGIGLSIVVDIVQSYDGEIKVGRSELGGARFEVILPPLGV